MTSTTDEPLTAQAVAVQVNRVQHGIADADLEQIDLYVESFYRSACELRKRYRAGLLELLMEEDGPKALHIGIKKFVATYPKQTECVDEPRTLEALFDYAQGDFAKVTEAFSSKALKHGYCSKVLPPEVYAACFRTELKPTLKETDSAPAKQLTEIDERWIR